MDAYTGAAATALRLIKAKGKLVTMTRTPTTGSSSGTVTAGTPITGGGWAISIPINASAGDVAAAFDNQLESGSLAGKTLRYLKIAALGTPFEPRSNDKIGFDGATWNVIGCTPIKPAATPIVYGVGVVQL